MAVRTDITDALLGLLPEDGSRLGNGAITAGLKAEVEEPFTAEDLEAAKAHLVAMGAAERVKGPGGGLRVTGPNGSAKAQSPSPERREQQQSCQRSSVPGLHCPWDDCRFCPHWGVAQPGGSHLG